MSLKESHISFVDQAGRRHYLPLHRVTYLSTSDDDTTNTYGLSVTYFNGQMYYFEFSFKLERDAVRRRLISDDEVTSL